MPMAAAKSTTSWKAAGSVPGWPMISAVLLRQIWLAKCSAKNFSGRPVKGAIALGSSVEELVARMVFWGRCGASAL